MSLSCAKSDSKVWVCVVGKFQRVVRVCMKSEFSRLQWLLKPWYLVDYVNSVRCDDHVWHLMQLDVSHDLLACGGDGDDASFHLQKTIKELFMWILTLKTVLFLFGFKFLPLTQTSVTIISEPSLNPKLSLLNSRARLQITKNTKTFNFKLLLSCW